MSSFTKHYARCFPPRISQLNYSSTHLCFARFSAEVRNSFFCNEKRVTFWYFWTRPENHWARKWCWFTKEKGDKAWRKIGRGRSVRTRDVLIFSDKTFPLCSKDENCLQTVRNLTRQHLNYYLPENEISITHRLGANNSNENKRSKIVKFYRKSTKTVILAAALKKKAPNSFVNECLTPTQRAIGYVLRKAKREYPNIISGSTTFGGIHNVWIRPPNPDAAGAQNGKQTITSLDRLETFCTWVLNKPVSYFIENWSD